MENARSYGDIKLKTTDNRRNTLASEPNYHTTKHFSKELMTIEMDNINVKMNKPVYLVLLIVDTIKVTMYEY